MASRRRFEISVRYECLRCNAPGDILVFAWPSRMFTGHVWCFACWEQCRGVLEQAGKTAPVWPEAERQ